MSISRVRIEALHRFNLLRSRLVVSLRLLNGLITWLRLLLAIVLESLASFILQMHLLLPSVVEDLERAESEKSIHNEENDKEDYHAGPRVV